MVLDGYILGLMLVDWNSEMSLVQLLLFVYLFFAPTRSLVSKFTTSLAAGYIII